jgi:TrpR-related protein YerC/YecD
MKSHLAKKESIHELMQAISLLKSSEEAKAFFTDLCTPAELEAMADRWQVVPLLRQEMAYRLIHERTGVSVTTITRIARCLTQGSGGYELIFNRQEAK